MTRYRSEASKRSMKSTLLRGFGWALLAVVVFAAGVGGGFYILAKETLHHGNCGNSAAKSCRAFTGVTTELWPAPPGAPVVALVAGYDHRAGTGTNSYAGSNSDTLMLLRANPKNHTLSLLSFPRDLNVPIYCKGDTIHTYDRINAAWTDCGGQGGPYAALDTIQHLTGGKVHVNYLITLDFRAFKQIVNNLYGVYVNVDRRYLITPDMGLNTSAVNLHPGYQKLNGGEALSFVRFRHFDSDIYRNGRQQIFLDALKSRLKSAFSISNFSQVLTLLGAVSDNLQYVKADGSDVGINEIKQYLGLIDTLPPGHTFRNAIPPADLPLLVVNGADELQAAPGAVDRVVHSFLHPKVPVVKVHHHKGPKTPKLPHKQISALVLNAGYRSHEAARTSFALHKQGFDMKHLPRSIKANAPSKAHKTVVYYDASQANGQKAAQELVPLFGAHTTIAPMTSDISSRAAQAGNPLVVVAIGMAYKGRLKLPHTGGGKSGGTSPASAKVVPGIPVTLSALRPYNGPAHFTLMLPHKVAAGSSISTSEGVRLFRPLHGKQELVLTYYMPVGPGEYWQIEESDWTTEPLLASPTAKFDYKGRTYEEFTNAGKIQQIAVRYGKNIYWVQNTILNSLSNATMIAIAESLRPLR